MRYNIRELGLAKKGIQLLFCDCESERRAAVCRLLKFPKKEHAHYMRTSTNTHGSGTRGYCCLSAGVGRWPFVLTAGFP